MKSALAVFLIIAAIAFVGVYVVNTVRLAVQKHREKNKIVTPSADDADGDGKDE